MVCWGEIHAFGRLLKGSGLFRLDVLDPVREIFGSVNRGRKHDELHLWR